MNLVCINCPLGCNLEVHEENGELKVSGNTCPRGEKYAISEMTNPTRMITSTIEIKGAFIDCLPVITSAPVPKSMIFDIMKELKGLKVEAPIEINQVIYKDILGTGVDIIASRTLKKVEKN